MVIVQQGQRIPEVRIFPPDMGMEQRAVARTWFGGGGDRRELEFSFGSQLTSNVNVAQDENQIPLRPFHMRPSNLIAFTASQNAYRNTYRTHSVAIQRARAGWVTSAAKSLDLVRQNLQQAINRDLDEVIKSYMDKYFAPAIENIKKNQGENAVGEEHVNTICKQILEDAKRMYSCSFTRESTPFGDNSDSETGSHAEMRAIGKGTPGRKRKDSDTDSEASLRQFKKKGRPPSAFSHSSGRVTPSKTLKSSDPVKKEGPKWEPDRLTKDTLFVMGARANKALGFGSTRGRLYIKHPEVFKYCGDSEDKQWLHDHNMMPATGGKAYMLVLDDIKELMDSDEYRNSSGLMAEELYGFVVPEAMLEKMRVCMNSQRTDNLERKPHRGRPPASHADPHRVLQAGSVGVLLTEYSGASPGDSSSRIMKSSGLESSGPTSPADDLDLLAAESSPAQASPFMLSSGLEDVSPADVRVSPTPSDFQAAIDNEPPMSAPFDVTECH